MGLFAEQGHQMITKVSKSTSEALDQVSSFLIEDQEYMKENFPQCKSKEEITEALRKAGSNWNILVVDHPVALFSLRSTGLEVTLERLCPEKPGALQMLIVALQSDFRNMNVASSVVILPEGYEQAFSDGGYQKTNAMVTFSKIVSETQLMPILPMTNLSEKDIPAIAKLMLESYANGHEKFQKDKSAEAYLRSIMKGTCGTFLSDASFTSGAQGNLVSACFVASDMPKVARVVQLFTHPLYRARGLATTELVTGMNRLRKLGVLTLTALIPQSNEVAVRLLTKLEFDRGKAVVEMVKPLGQK
jgi:ribosomal protein S18 acetylase RimI-like enzyme